MLTSTITTAHTSDAQQLIQQNFGNIFPVTSSTSLRATRYLITIALADSAVLIVMVMVIFIFRHDIIIITPVGAILKATQVSAIQDICHSGPDLQDQLHWQDNSSRTAFEAGRPPIQSVASLPSSVHQPHPRGGGISGHRLRLRFQIVAW